jgi:hypothetical protein
MLLSPFGFDNSSSPGYVYSTDRGITWIQNNNGLPSSPKMSAFTYQIQGSNIKYYAGLFENTTDGAKVYTLSSPIGIEPISNEVPNGFSLSQNYPNPFNPSSKIKFQITKLSSVKLVVFDALGREIETLVNEQLKAGTYEVNFDGGKLSSGVYYYKMIADDYTETRKMILVK